MPFIRINLIPSCRWLRLFSWAVLLLLLPLRAVHAQNEDLRFSHISIRDGLSQSTVLSIIQDSRGFLWFGTEDGLNRYDGYDFTIFKYDPHMPSSLSYNYINTLCESVDGDLWIGTFGGGLNRFDRDTETFTRFRDMMSNPSSLTNDYVNAILEDREGRIWVGTQNGLNRLDPGGERFSHYFSGPEGTQKLEKNYINALLEDSRGCLWIGTQDGLYSWDRENDRIVQKELGQGGWNSPDPEEITCLFESKTGVLWIGTENGLYRLNQEEPGSRSMAGPRRVNGLSHEHITSILEDKGGVLWVGTLKGLNRHDSKNNQFTSFYSRPDVPGSLSNDEIFSICEDLSGVLWIGTHLGLNKCEKKRNEFTLFQPGSGLGLSNGLVRTIGEYQGLLWVGTYDGLNIIDRKNRSCRVLRHEAGNTNSVSSDRIMSIYRGPSGKYWLGTHDGLDMYDPVSESFTHFRPRPNDPSSLSNPRVRVVYGDRSRRIWIGTENGLNRMERDQSSFRRFLYNPADTTSISDNYIYSVLQDREGNLWVGTLNGLNCYDQTEKRFRRFMADPNRTGTLSDNAVLSLYEDSEGTLWVGTSAGLNRFNRERNQFDQYTRKDGLPNDMICAILEDERGRLWLSTSRGLCRMEKKTKRFRNYTESDGLQSDEFNPGAAFRSPGGEMFFGGINGFNAFFPDSIKEDFVFPKVVITDFQIYNRSVPIGKMDGRKAILDRAISETDSIVLSHGDRSFSFSFAALHYHSPEKNQYAYRMEGLEKEWNYVSSRRFVTYTNLPPRKYVFRVRASNSDGIWSPNGVSVHIRIVPPFYNTWWFKVSLIFSALSLIRSLYFVRTRSITLRNRELEKRVQARTAELESVNQELKDFAYIVSHDLKAPLRAIGSLANWIVTDYHDHFDKPGREMLQLMTGRVKRMNELIDGILQYSRIGRIREKKVSVDLNQVVKHVVEMIAPPDNIKIEIANELPVIECEETRIMQVYQNLIGNAVKYMDKPEGKVSIGCEKESDHWTFRISDNGPGIDPCYHDKIFQIFQTLSSKDKDSTGIGLSLVKKIVEMYGGRIWVESQAGHGSTFIFTLPN